MAIVDGQFSLKRVVLDGNRLKLASANRTMPAYAVKEFAEVDLWGVSDNIRWHVARNSRGAIARG